MKKNLFILMAGALALCACDPSGKEPGNGPTPPAGPEIKLAWAYEIGGYAVKGNVPAVDDAGNVYMNSAVTNEVYKISPAGDLVWKVAPGYANGTQASVTIEADGSAVYASGGAKADGGTQGLYVLDANGAVTGTFLNEKFYNKGGVPAITINAHTAVSYDDSHIYIGNGSSTGTAISIDKSDLSRIAYVSGSADGTGGPAGGCCSNLAISKAGKFMFHGGNYGVFIVDKAKFDNPVDENPDAGYGDYVCFDQRVFHDNGGNWNAGKTCGIACGAINDVEHFFYVGREKNTNTTFVAAVKADGTSNTPTYVYKFPVEMQNQDQGGIIVGAQGEVIFSSKHNDQFPGGLYAINGNGELAWKYLTNTHISGAAALDAEGHVHVADEAGFYYVVKPDYENQTATEVLKVDLLDLMRKGGVEVAETATAKSWTSIVIGNDGKCYVAPVITTEAGESAHVLCLDCNISKGPGASSWPMKFANQYHSGIEK